MRIFGKFVAISFPRFGNPEHGSCQLSVVSVSSQDLGYPRPGIPWDRAG